MDALMQDLLNDGLITNNPPSPDTTRTIAVSGVARSGTSMVAQLLGMAGVFMGEDLDDVVFEDHAVADAFDSAGLDRLERLIASRNEQGEVWGFKRPHLFHRNGPELQAMFRNPRFIVTFRDPVAVARRNGISEHVETALALRTAAEDIQRCIDFALALTCPVLLVSYEKALLRPAALVDALARFCSLEVASEQRTRMVAAVKADRDEYVQFARRRFQGYVDHIRNGVLTGWCWQVGVPTPLMLEVSIGDRPRVAVIAGGFRTDLANAEVGTGHHAFRLDLAEIAPTDEEHVAVRVQGRLFQLSGSGRTVAELSGQK